MIVIIIHPARVRLPTATASSRMDAAGRRRVRGDDDAAAGIVGPGSAAPLFLAERD